METTIDDISPRPVRLRIETTFPVYNCDPISLLKETNQITARLAGANNHWFIEFDDFKNHHVWRFQKSVRLWSCLSRYEFTVMTADGITVFSGQDSAGCHWFTTTALKVGWVGEKVDKWYHKAVWELGLLTSAESCIPRYSIF